MKRPAQNTAGVSLCMEVMCQCNCVQLTCVVLRGSVDDTADDHEDAAGDDAGLPTESISDSRPELEH